MCTYLAKLLEPKRNANPDRQGQEPTYRCVSVREAGARRRALFYSVAILFLFSRQMAPLLFASRRALEAERKRGIGMDMHERTLLHTSMDPIWGPAGEEQNTENEDGKTETSRQIRRKEKKNCSGKK